MKAIKKETPEALSAKVKILIDTNIYLDFYRSKKDSIKLLSELAKHFDKIILTDQIIQEFERNREVVINEMKKAFELDSNILYKPSAFLENLQEFTELVKSLSDYHKKRKLVIGAMDMILEAPEKDPVYAFFTDMVRECTRLNTLLYTTDEILNKAHKRKLIGNPPTSPNYSIGDEINWEVVLSNVKENIIIIGRDNTYTKNFSYLKRDFHSRTGRLILKKTDKITDALTEIGISTSTELKDVEKTMIAELENFNDFWKPESYE